MIPAAPRMVIDVTETGPEPVAALRAEDLCVESIRIVPGGSWCRKDVGKARGDDYQVPETDLVRALLVVIDQGRLSLPAEPPLAEAVRSEIERVRSQGRFITSTESMEFPRTALSVALAVWFREIVPYKRAYRAI